jgi:hypothetical protein
MIKDHAQVEEVSLSFLAMLVLAQRQQHQAANALRIAFSRASHLNDLPGDNLGYRIGTLLQSESPTAGLERSRHRMNGRLVKHAFARMAGHWHGPPQSLRPNGRYPASQPGN